MASGNWSIKLFDPDEALKQMSTDRKNSTHVALVPLHVVDTCICIACAPTAKFKTAKILFSNPHTSTSPITGDLRSLYTWKPLIMLSVVCASMLIGRAAAVYYGHASWVWRFAKLKHSEKFDHGI